MDGRLRWIMGAVAACFLLLLLPLAAVLREFFSRELTSGELLIRYGKRTVHVLSQFGSASGHGAHPE
eukprot:2553805-Prymnesium_polylepis.1